MPDISHILVSVATQYAFDREVLAGIARAAHSYGNIHLHLKSAERSFEYSVDDVKAGGMIVSTSDQATIAAVAKTGLPSVNVANYLEAHVSVPVVGNDDEAISKMIATHYLDRGFRHFAFFYDPTVRYFDTRRDAFVAALGRAGFDCAVGPSELQAADRPQKRWEGHAGEWLASLPKPLGVMCPYDGYADEAVQASQAGGLRVPEEVSIIGVDDDPVLCSTVWPQISSVATSGARIGQMATELLKSMMEGEPPPPRPVLVPPREIVVRGSSSESAIEDPDVAAAVQFIRSHLRHRITVDDLVEHVAISRRSLERKFTTAIRRTPLEEIARARLAQAKKLLIDTDLALPEIARRSGMIRHQRLSNVLKADSGLTPSQFRAQYRREP